MAEDQSTPDQLHIILVQGPTVGLRCALVTTLTGQQNQLGCLAHLLPEDMERRQLLALRDLSHLTFSTTHSCEVSIIGPAEEDNGCDVFQDGSRLEIQVLSLQDGSDPEALSEDLSLTQLHAKDQPQKHATNRGKEFCFNPRAVAFVPSRPILELADEFIQDLHQMWGVLLLRGSKKTDLSAPVITCHVNHAQH